MLGELGFENAYALVMPRKKAEALGIKSIADLAKHSSGMTMAADYEFFSRPEWAGLQKAYRIGFRAQRQMQPDFMYAAVASGEIDVIAGYTSDGLIAKYDLVVLDDAKRAIPPYDAILLLSDKRAEDQALRAALQPLLGRIDIATMREAKFARSGRRREQFAGCGRALAVGEDREEVTSKDDGVRSEILDHPGIDQEPIEAPGLRTVLAGVEHALAAQHDLLLLLERRIERDAGGLLDHQRQVGTIDRIHHRLALHRLEVDGVDRVVRCVVAGS